MKGILIEILKEELEMARGKEEDTIIGMIRALREWDKMKEDTRQMVADYFIDRAKKEIEDSENEMDRLQKLAREESDARALNGYRYLIEEKAVNKRFNDNILDEFCDYLW